jgi:hypothetical protein
MNATSKVFHVVAVLVLTTMLWVSVPAARADGPITVNTTTNALGDGLCSLEEAVAAANSNASQDSGACPAGSNAVQDIIEFDISGSGPHVITLTSWLSITQAVTLDGASEPDWAGTPVVEITNNLAYILIISSGATYSAINELQFTSTYPGTSDTAYAVRVNADGVALTGNYFNTDGVNRLGMGAGGVLIYGSNALVGTGAAADRNLFGGRIGFRIMDGSLNFLKGNYFGVQPDGNAALAGTASTLPAIQISGEDETSGNHLVNGNVVAGYGIGVQLYHPSNHNTITGNYIGVGADGATSLGNTIGLQILGSSSNTIGGTHAGDRNVISASTSSGNIYLVPWGVDPESNVIRGNYIGTTADGLTALPTGVDGIHLEGAASTEIGGTEPGSGNLISGNDFGIYGSSGATNTIIQGNWIGLDATGMHTLGNTGGIFLSGGSANIGDETTRGLNVISGNGLGGWAGIDLRNSASATIFGNRFGLSATGAAVLPNRVSIYLEDASAVISENWIANTTVYGVQSDDGTAILSGSDDNCFTGNAFGAANPTDPDASWPNNWWGNATGPTHLSNPGGTGDAIGENVLYSPFRTSRPWACRGAPVDFDGDDDTDVSVFRAGTWYVRNQFVVGWGQAGDVPIPADFDGDHDSDVAVYRPSTGGWRVKDQFTVAYGGIAGDVPVPADYDGDGDEDVAIYRSSTAGWYIKDQFLVGYGLPTDIPVPGDYDGDSITDIAVFRDGVWYIRNQGVIGWGQVGDIPIPGDYDGDGDTDLAVYRPSTGGWRVKDQFTVAYGGVAGDIPVPGDYDQDGDIDVAIYRASTAGWYVKDLFTAGYGLPTDYPVPAPDTNGDGDPYQ